MNWRDIIIGFVFAGFAVCCALRVWLLLRIEGVLISERPDLRGARAFHALDPFREFRWTHTLQASGHPLLGRLAPSLRRLLVWAYLAGGLFAVLIFTRAWR